MRFTTIPIFLILLFFHISGFAQNPPKTIYELYQIEKEGCDFYDASGKFVDEEVMIEKVPEYFEEVPPAPPAAPDSKPLTTADELNAMFGDFQKAMAAAPAFVPEDIHLKNGNFCFFEKEKWGLKSSSGKVMIKPKFDYVFPDTINGGFSAYEGATCNYYDGSTGKKQFNQDYYWIQSTEKEAFIVRSKTGYGLLKAGKIIVEAEKQHINKGFDGQEVYYRITDDKIGPYILRNDLKTQFPFASSSKPRFAGQEFVVSDMNIFNLKTKKKLVCSNDFTFKLISIEKHLAAIKKKNENHFYLIDFEGNILSENTFSNIEMISEYGTGIAYVFDKNSKSQHPPQLSGLINATGEWIVQPEYKIIQQYKEKGYWIARYFNNLQGVMDHNGKFVIPVEYSAVQEISEGRYLCTTQSKGATQSKIINAITGQVEKQGLDFHTLRKYQFCDRALFIAGTKDGELVIGENFLPLTATHQRIFSEGDYIVGADFNVPNVGKEKRLYDCVGKPISVSINGKTVAIFQEIIVINENLMYVYFKEGDIGYFISKNGQAYPIQGQMASFRPSGLKGFLTAQTQAQNAGLIDFEGNLVIPCKLKYLTDFKEETGMACFGLRKETDGIVTAKGAILNNKIYQQTYYIGFGKYTIKDNDKQGLIDASGKVLLAPEYSNISISEGMIKAVKEGNAVSLFDITGQPVK